MAKSLTSSKSPQEKFPGKNRIRKIREKSGYEISDIWGHILRMDSIKYCFITKSKSFFVILANFDIFHIKISKAICNNSLKIGLIYVLYLIWIHDSK